MGLFDKIKNVFKKEEKSINTYEKGLSKTRKSFVNKLANLSKEYGEINDNYFEELEELLINADIGVNTVMDFMDKLQERVSKEKITNPEELTEIIVDELFIIYVNDDILTNKINYNPNGPTVILFVGVNGVGKTTTIAKLASKYKKDGKKVLLVAADTFRAGAKEQLESWGEKIGCEVVKDDNTKDPASVVYKGLEKAVQDKYDIVLIDTAGRLQNKVNLMKELEKMTRVIGREIEGAPQEVWLVLDATTGQNGISQAQVFLDATHVTGIVLTKMDGTAKGGVVLSIHDMLHLPVRFLGLGEKPEDLRPFDVASYIMGMTKGMNLHD